MVASEHSVDELIELVEELQERVATLEAENERLREDIDGTHVAAWATARREIEDGDVEGANWGNTKYRSTGAKVFPVVDAALGLPVAIMIMTGNCNDNGHKYGIYRFLSRQYLRIKTILQ